MLHIYIYDISRLRVKTPLLQEISVGPQKHFSPHLTYTQRLISLRQVTFSAHSGSYQLELQILVSIFLCLAYNKVNTDYHYEAFILPVDNGQVFELLIRNLFPPPPPIPPNCFGFCPSYCEGRQTAWQTLRAGCSIFKVCVQFDTVACLVGRWKGNYLFQTFAVFCMLCAFFWVILRRLNFFFDVSEHTVCLIFIGG